ncbi:MAG: long-chain fatty acid--CoA ligase [Deltaproteobacteria bacterium]|jgi:fatty-acyl-CoA synthase|nr:long-chain fatty acid--CoA ligase [Deltaproteobacteria bacterium]MBW2532043.1 long-chain fatty acid--CoA ligase [Deltaproteobacteria bacterium]
MLHGDILGERARLTPDKTALVIAATGERLSYRELDERASRTARAWRTTLGLAKGDRLAILSNNRAEFLEVFFAAAKSGVVVVPLGTKLTPKELEYILRDAGAKALCYAAAFAETVRALQRCVDLPHFITFDEPVRREDASHGKLRDRAAGDAPRLERCKPDDVYCLLYTSGTTGRPKGVIIPHRMIAWNALNTVANWQLREDDVSPVFTPLYHAGGLGAFIGPIFAVGGTIVLHDGFVPSEVLATIVAERCTVVLGVPTIFRMLLDDEAFGRTDLSRVRWFISGGAPLPPALVDDYQGRGVVLRQGYGLTEVGVNCFSMTSEEALSAPGFIGRPMMFTEAKLCDEQGREVECGEVGELCLRGPHVSAGYWNNPEATRAAYDPEGFFHTGDLACCDDAGQFRIVGRRTDMYISGGVNVYPPEVEAELLLHPDIDDVAIIGVPDPRWGETGVAFVLPRPGSTVRREGVLQFLYGRLAKYKLPRRIEIVDELPRTPYGKVKKHELRRAYLAGSLHLADTPASVPALVARA